MACAKREVTCTIFTVSGKNFTGTNDCRNPQPKCPRFKGEGYAKCTTICRQGGHAETQALKLLLDSKESPLGAEAHVFGHYYCCKDCAKILADAGVSKIIIHVEK